ncbi:MAG: winged helix-turn-helix domain-containing protein [Halorientalis sp.]
MPVDLDSHTAEVTLTPGTTKSDIVVFLYEHEGYGYRPAEVAARLDIPRGTATTTLGRLSDEGYVGKTPDGYYHALADHEQVRRYLSSLAQVERLFGHGADREGQSASGTTAGEGGVGAADADVESDVEEPEADPDG